MIRCLLEKNANLGTFLKIILVESKIDRVIHVDRVVPLMQLETQMVFWSAVSELTSVLFKIFKLIKSELGAFRITFDSKLPSKLQQVVQVDGG